MSNQTHKVIILGSGPAGYSAALYAARANFQPVLLSGLDVGGQLMTTTTVDNWIGDNDGVMGPDLMERMKKHSLKFGTQIIADSITSVAFNEKPFKLIGDKNTYYADSVIIATGSKAKYLGLKSEQNYLGKGVSSCATCDGFFYKDQVVAVVGGGNTAIEEALYLSNIAKKVILIHRRDTFRAEAVMIDELYKKVSSGTISLKLNSTLKEVLGDKRGVNAINICNNLGHTEQIQLQGVFIAIGHKPATEIFDGVLEMKNNYLLTNFNGQFATQTSIKGVFAAGDVADPVYRQAITSAATGCMAALDAKNYLQTL